MPGPDHHILASSFEVKCTTTDSVLIVVALLTKILVATDFSEHSKRVVEYAFDLKRIFGATM
jgi:Universal stress protein family